MNDLDAIVDRIRDHLEDKNSARDRALKQSRTLIRHCSLAIRAVHRDERETAAEHLKEARDLVGELQKDLAPYPDLFHAGYTQDALKEFSEASITAALVAGEALPAPEALQVEYAAYLGGLGEAAGELRRRVLDLIRRDEPAESERLLAAMDDIYGSLVTVDYPDAITGGLRRITDMVRGVTERTRGDLTTNAQQLKLMKSLQASQTSHD
jgi:translin